MQHLLFEEEHFAARVALPSPIITPQRHQLWACRDLQMSCSELFSPIRPGVQELRDIVLSERRVVMRQRDKSLRQ